MLNIVIYRQKSLKSISYILSSTVDLISKLPPNQLSHYQKNSIFSNFLLSTCRTFKSPQMLTVTICPLNLTEILIN